MPSTKWIRGCFRAFPRIRSAPGCRAREPAEHAIASEAKHRSPSRRPPTPSFSAFPLADRLRVCSLRHCSFARIAECRGPARRKWDRFRNAVQDLLRRGRAPVSRITPSVACSLPRRRYLGPRRPLGSQVRWYSPDAPKLYPRWALVGVGIPNARATALQPARGSSHPYGASSQRAVSATDPGITARAALGKLPEPWVAPGGARRRRDGMLRS